MHEALPVVLLVFLDHVHLLEAQLALSALEQLALTGLCLFVIGVLDLKPLRGERQGGAVRSSPWSS